MSEFVPTLYLCRWWAATRPTGSRVGSQIDGDSMNTASWFDLRRRWMNLAVNYYWVSFVDEWTARRWAASEWEAGWPQP